MGKSFKKAILALADGTVFEGESFGAEGEASGEVVFTTGMTGYQEILTDPSYKGQIVTMTYPQIGNYGVNFEDEESFKPQVEGFVVKEYVNFPSNWRAKKSVEEYLKENRIVAMEGIDTRALTRHIRSVGAQQGIISTEDLNPKSLAEKARALPGLVGRDLVREVTCQESYLWTKGLIPWQRAVPTEQHNRRTTNDGRRTTKFKVVAYDFGIKRNILRMLVEAGCEVWVVPANTPAERVLAINPYGMFLSNGPGDPAALPYIIENVKKLIGEKPIFGICLGHQILGLALGGRTFKLKFGHRGTNQPVKDLTTGKVEITSQNHGFVVDMESLKDVAEVTHINLNDGTVEGLAHKDFPLFSVQYHPEASPGPHDAFYLFKRFVDMMAYSRP